jgi:hypothetical protein
MTGSRARQEQLWLAQVFLLVLGVFGACAERGAAPFVDPHTWLTNASYEVSRRQITEGTELPASVVFRVAEEALDQATRALTDTPYAPLSNEFARDMISRADWEELDSGLAGNKLRPYLIRAVEERPGGLVIIQADSALWVIYGGMGRPGKLRCMPIIALLSTPPSSVYVQTQRAE